MELFGDVVAWFSDPEQWSGPDGIPLRTLQHIWLAVFPTLIAVVLAVPPAVFLAHRGRGKFTANTLVNLGRAIPSFGILVVAAILFIRAGLPFRFWPTVLALLVLAIPPIFTNTYAGVADVSAALIEAGRGMGFKEADIVRRLEVPVAAPVILAGIEIAFVQVVATVPLAAVISGGGGLGQYIVRGFAQGAAAADETFAGALLVAAITLIMQQAFSIGERVLLPPGIQRLRSARS